MKQRTNVKESERKMEKESAKEREIVRGKMDPLYILVLVSLVLQGVLQ